MEEIQTFHSSYFLGKSYFSNNRLQNYLILPLFYKTINKLTATQTIEALESNGLSSESIATPATSDNNFSHNTKSFRGSKISLKYDLSCVKHQR